MKGTVLCAGEDGAEEEDSGDYLEPPGGNEVPAAEAIVSQEPTTSTSPTDLAKPTSIAASSLESARAPSNNTATKQTPTASPAKVATSNSARGINSTLFLVIGVAGALAVLA
jgi:hypothetical protein